MNSVGKFKVHNTDSNTDARRATLQTAHGPVETPVFMPVGTRATVKSMSPADMRELDCEILLGNTYHLNDRPGVEIIDKAGGLHRFMGWDRAILTDSGGFQVFSLADSSQISDEGVRFQSHLDGTQHFLGPREAMDIQRRLGSDIAMVFDQCPPYPCDRDYACKAVERTIEWAGLCAKAPRAEGQLVFGIVQGGLHADLREECASELCKMDFDGYAVGGVSVGESGELILKGVNDSVCHLPDDKPRYLMGVGELSQMVESVARGIDMFDCVMPTRMARNGTVLTRRGRYPVRAGAYKADFRPLEDGCECYVCRNFSRAYLRHLLNVNEMLGAHLVTKHNLFCYLELMEEMRAAIEQNEFDDFREQFHREYEPILWEHRELMHKK